MLTEKQYVAVTIIVGLALIVAVALAVSREHGQGAWWRRRSVQEPPAESPPLDSGAPAEVAGGT